MLTLAVPDLCVESPRLYEPGLERLARLAPASGETIGS
jgi:hypothetical protein